MERQDKLIQAALAVSSELSLDVVLQRIIEIAAEITGARYGALGVIGAGGELTEFITTGLTPQERDAIGPLPVGHGLLGVLIREAVPIRVSPISSHPESIGFPPNHPHMTSLLGAPIVSRGTVFGDIYLTDKDGGEPFTEEDQRDLLVLAAQAGVAIENAQLYEEVHRLAVLEDRERIA
jgi:GAF domain-containing protein